MDLPDFARSHFREPERSRLRIEDLAWSPDGLLLAAVGQDADVIRFWDIDGNASRHRFQEKTDPAARATALDWTPDGLRLAIGGDRPGTNRLFSLENGAYALLDWHEPVTRLAWCSAGRRLAFGGPEGAVMVCYPDEGSAAWHGADVPTGPVCGLAWLAPDWVIAMTEGSLQPRAWDFYGGPRYIDPMPSGTAPTCVIIHPNGNCLTAGGVGGDLLTWDPLNPCHTHRVGAHPGPVRALSWHHSESLLASACDRTLAFWRPGSFDPVHAVPLEGRAHRLAWHPRGEVLALVTHEPDRLTLIDFRPLEIDPRYADGEPPND